jgi:hypothetical protein
MSDVVVSVVESATNVVVSEQDVAVAITETNVEVSSATAGIQGATGPQGASYAPGDPIFVTVRNATGASLPKGTIVYTSGANGNHVQVSPALATSDATSARVLGWLSQTLVNNADGFCQVEGYLEGLNTQGFTAGQQLYLSGTVAGGFTATKPQAPIHLVYVGVVTKVSAGDGHVYIKTQNGYELDEIHDVQITSVANNDVLQYESATDLWKNRTLTNAGIASLAGGNIFTGTQTITGAGSGTTLASLNTLSGQNVLAVGDSGGFGVVNVTNGTFYVGLQSYFYGAGDYGASINVQAKSASTQAIIARARASQSGDLLQLQDSAGNVYLRMTAFGGISTNLGASYPGRLSIGTGSASTIGAVIRGVASQTADLQQWQDDVGSVRIAIDSTGRIMSQSSANFGSFPSGLAVLGVRTSSASTTVAILRGAASQTGSMLQFQNDAGTITANFTAPVNNVNRLNLGGTDLSATLGITVHASGGVGQVIRGAAGQSVDFWQVQNSAGGVLAKVDSVGDITARVLRSQLAARIATNDVNVAPMVSTTIAGQVSNNTEWQNETGVVASVSASGLVRATGGFRTIGAGTIEDVNGIAPYLWLRAGTIEANARTATFVPLTIKGATSQSASLTAWQNSAGSLVATMSPAGDLALYGNGITSGDHRVGTATYLSATLNVITRATTEKGLVIRGQASQTANLQEWQNSSGTITARVTSSGEIQSITNAVRGVQLFTFQYWNQLQERNSGGELTMTKQTAASTNPGAESGRIYFRDGTVPGTLKLVVRAGAAGAETTILDNIPQ